MQQQSNRNKIAVKFDEVKPYLNCNKNGEYSFNCEDYKDKVNTVKPCFTIEVMDRTYTVQIVKLVHESEVRSNKNTTNHIVYTECLETGIVCDYQTHYLSTMFNHQDTEKAFNFAIRLTITGKDRNQEVNRQAINKYYEKGEFEQQIQLIGTWTTDTSKSMIYCIGGGVVVVDRPHNYIGKTRQADKTSRAKNGHKHNIKDDDIASGNLMYREFAKYGNIIMMDTLDDEIIEYFETMMINLMAYVTGKDNINDKQRGKDRKQQKKRILEKLVDIVFCKVEFLLCLSNLEELCGLFLPFIVDTDKVQVLCEEIGIKFNRHLCYLIDLVCGYTDISFKEITQAIKSEYKKHHEIVVDEVRVVRGVNRGSIKPPKKEIQPPVESEEQKAKLDRLVRMSLELDKLW